MLRLIYKGFIEDIKNEKCTDKEVEKLIDVFEEAVNLMAATSEKKLSFDLKYFEKIDCTTVNSFTLNLERKPIKNFEKYIGYFECKNKNLKIFAIRGNFTASILVLKD